MEVKNTNGSSTSARCSRDDLAGSLQVARAEIGGALVDLLATVLRHLRQTERLRRTIPGRAIQYDLDHVVHDLFTAREQMRSIAAKLKRAARLAETLETSAPRTRSRARTSSRKIRCASKARQS